MAKDSSGLILLGVGAGIAYWGYTQGWFASWGLSPTAVAATPAPAPTPTMPAAASTSAALPSATTMPATATPSTAVATVAPSTSAPSGPSLAAMLSALQAQLSANASDPALSNVAGAITSTYDVFNWYLVHANVGVTDGQLQAPDHTSQISLAQYWAWAAPQLQSQIPGLSGFGHIYAGLGAIMRQMRGW